MAMTVGELKAILTVDDKQFNAGINKAQSSFSRFGSAIGKIALAGAVAAGVLVTKSIKTFNDFGGSIKNLTRMTGMSTEAASKFVGQWQRFGVTAQAGTTGVKFLTKNLDTAQQSALKTQTAIDGLDKSSKTYDAQLATLNTRLTSNEGAFHRLGVELFDSEGKLRKIDEILPEVRDKLSLMKDEGKRTALTLKLFGKGGADMLKWLDKSPAAIKAVNKELAALGMVWGDKQIKTYEQLKEAQRKMGLQWTAMQLQLAQTFIPILQKVMGWISALMDKWNSLSDATKVWVLKAGAALAVLGLLAPKFNEVAKVIGVLRGVWIALTGAQTATAVATGAVTGAIGVQTGVIGANTVALKANAVAARLVSPVAGGGWKTTTAAIGAQNTAVTKLGGGFKGAAASVSSFIGLHPVGIIIGIGVAAIAATLLIDKMTRHVVASAQDIKKSYDKQEASAKLKSWSERALGGTIVEKAGRLVWQPTVKVDAKKQTTTAIGDWVKTTQAEAQRAADTSAAYQYKLDQMAQARAAEQLARDRAAQIANQKTRGGGVDPRQSEGYKKQIALAEQYSRKVWEIGQTVDAVNRKQVAVQIKMDLKEGHAKLKSIDADLKRLNGQKSTPEVRLKIAQLEQQKAKVTRELNQLERKNHTILLQAKVDQANRNIDTLRAKIKSYDGKTMTTHMKLEKAQYERDLKAAVAQRDKLKDKLPDVKAPNVTGGKKSGAAGGRDVRDGFQATAPAASAAGSSVGASLISGVGAGIANNQATAIAMGGAAVDNIIREMRARADSASPSKKTMKLGADMALGLMLGLKKGQAAVINAASELSSSILTVLQNALGIGGAITDLKAQGLPKISDAKKWAKKVGNLMKTIIKVMQSAFKGIDIGKAVKGDKNGFGEKSQGWKAEAFGSVISMAEGIGSIFTTFTELTTEKIDAAVKAIGLVKLKAKEIGTAVSQMVKALIKAFKKTTVTEAVGANAQRIIDTASAISGIITSFAEITDKQIDKAVLALKHLAEPAVITPIKDAVQAVAVAISDAFKDIKIDSETAAAAMDVANGIAGIVTTFAEMTEGTIKKAIEGLNAVKDNAEGLKVALIAVIDKITVAFSGVTITPEFLIVLDNIKQFTDSISTIIHNMIDLPTELVINAIAGAVSLAKRADELGVAVGALITAIKDAFGPKNVDVTGLEATLLTLGTVSEVTSKMSSIVSDLASITEEAIGLAQTGATNAANFGSSLATMIDNLGAALDVIPISTLNDLQDKLTALGNIQLKIAQIVNELTNMTSDKVSQASQAGTLMGAGFLEGLKAQDALIISEAAATVAAILALYATLPGGAAGPPPPPMAAGGYVPATPGGTVVRLGEGGQGEFVVPESQMGRGGGDITLQVSFSGPVHATSPAQAQQVGNDIAVAAIKMLGQSRRQTSRGVAR